MSLPRTRQTLLDEHFNPENRRGRYVHFFDLPPSLRERIYKDACREEMYWACVKTRFALNDPRFPTLHWYFTPRDVGEFETAASLLLTCRKIHDEMFKIVYSRNDFVIYGGTPTDLNVLRKLGPRNLASLSQLTVHLDISHVATPSICYYTGYGRDNCSRHRQTMVPTTSQQGNLQNWHDVLNDILPHLPRSGFSLNLTCDLESTSLPLARSIARQLLSPLHGRLTLSSSSIQLSPYPNMELRALAEEVAMRATGQPPLLKQRISLLDLPHEVRIQILVHTDLVTPRKEVEWRPGQGYWTSISWAVKTGACSIWSAETEPAMIFCRHVHAAFSPACRCWISPLPLFLTCKTLCLEAEQVFFEQNRIVIKPSVGINRIAECTPPILEASHYLRNVIPARALRHLRSLEIVFSPLKGAFLQATEPAYPDWLTTLDYVKDKLFYPRLVLRVCFSAWASNHASYGPQWDPELPDEKKAEIFESYRRTLFPLSVLRAHGLRNLHIDLALPSWLHVEQGSGRRKDRRRRPWAESVRTEIETRVMGEGYTSIVSDLDLSLWRLAWDDRVFRSECRYIYNDPTMDTVGL